ncbi:hypothetical protein GFS24_12005 [Chitinophaga sp. SYP-B3965]|uniref:MauE/DoxX family redox-associated membrane protein n=1 Tax=Chitinophaga sp. SYP-B3965 TaxID=2663120 RepID=UPI0012996559|nr:MauE/DoxX family redox-associated membrane protein [Chitinophaga sp. SYP-B3965]MRG45843.1 hypothetical protein [Chitinophaga sp. SYP-B3965]
MKDIQPKPWRLWAVEIVTALLLVFFVHSAIDNFLNFLSLKNLLWFYTRSVGAVASSIIIIEAGIAILLFLPRTRLAGLILSLLFLLTLTIIVARTPHSPHLFGGVLNYLGKRWYLPFEITMIVLTSIAIYPKILLRSKPTVLQHSR